MQVRAIDKGAYATIERLAGFGIDSDGGGGRYSTSQQHTFDSAPDRVTPGPGEPRGLG